jgi:hypothetical protein
MGAQMGIMNIQAACAQMGIMNVQATGIMNEQAALLRLVHS